MPGLLPYGADFDGDGLDEQVCLSRGQVLQISGDGMPTVRDPGGDQFYPQVYSAKRLGEPDWDERVDGAPVLLFEPLPWGGGTHLLIVRENYLGLYDTRKNEWAFTWAPPVRIAAAAIVDAGTDLLQVLAVTVDDLLWQLNWRGNLRQLDHFATRPLGDRIRRMTSRPGQCILAGERGLYRLRRLDDLGKVADGAYQDAAFLTRGEPSIIAVTDDGRVVRLQADITARESRE
jgi:hypothetical protein